MAFFGKGYAKYGRRSADTEVEEATEIFGDQAPQNAPLLTEIFTDLRQSEEGLLKNDFFLDILGENSCNHEGSKIFDTAVSWGRNADLFEFHIDPHEKARAEEIKENFAGELQGMEFLSFLRHDCTPVDNIYLSICLKNSISQFPNVPAFTLANRFDHIVFGHAEPP